MKTTFRSAYYSDLKNIYRKFNEYTWISNTLEESETKLESLAEASMKEDKNKFRKS